MTVFMLMMLAIMCYLIGIVAYNEGRKSKWEEMSREYICIHKSVCIQQCEPKKPLDKHKKKKYNKFTTSNK
jgi:hypothetical protein